MKTLISISTILIATFYVHPVLADGNHPGRCWGPYQLSDLLSRRIVYTSNKCAPGITLALVRGAHNYPAFGRLEVDYWEGSYVRPAHVTDTYQITTYNCYGSVIESHQTVQQYDTQISFLVDNPNFHDDVTTSFEANAPMTDTEATEALAVAETQCLNAHSDP